LKKVLFYIASISLLSCQNFTNNDQETKKGNILVTVGDTELYFSDIPTNILHQVEKKDSSAIIDKYIKNWIEEEILFLQAKDKISNLQELELKAKHFKRELINASYKKELLANFEVSIDDADLTKTYESNKEYFAFEEKHVSLNYILIPKTTANIAKIKKAISKGEQSHWVDNFCKKEKDKCFLDKPAIKPLSYIIETLKIKSLQTTKNFNYQYVDAENILLYKINTIYKVGDIAPLEVVINTVTNLAIHNKKQENLEEIIEIIIQNANNDKIVEKYNN